MIPRAIIGQPRSSFYVGSHAWHQRERQRAELRLATANLRRSVQTLAAAYVKAVNAAAQSFAPVLRRLKDMDLGGQL